MDFCAAFSGSFLVPAWVFGNMNVKIIREEAKYKFTLTFLTVVWRKNLHGQNIYFHERVNKLYKKIYRKELYPLKRKEEWKIKASLLSLA
jgi:hypothetical protein